jgi:hypothetical protein
VELITGSSRRKSRLVKSNEGGPKPALVWKQA